MQLVEEVLGKRNNVKIIRHLAMHKEWQFNITELAKDLDLNKGVLSRLIEELERKNVIKVNKKGKIKLFSINKENLFIKEIMGLFEKERNFYREVLKDLIKKVKEKVVAVILYGSYASGKAKLNSDMDVIIIIKKKDKNYKNLEEEVNKFKEEFLKKDLLLRVDLMTILELKNLYKIKEPFIKTLSKNHKILYGKSLRELIG